MVATDIISDGIRKRKQKVNIEESLYEEISRKVLTGINEGSKEGTGIYHKCIDVKTLEDGYLVMESNGREARESIILYGGRVVAEIIYRKMGS